MSETTMNKTTNLNPNVQEAELVPAEVPAARAVESGRKPASVPGLAAALALAQQKCRAAEKDSVNTFHRYKYASSEAIITEAKEALADTGLSLVPVEQTLDGHSREGEGRYELVRKFLLLHTSGESLPIVSHWPVVPEKGRPLDKATAIAATLSLAYLLRDLLLMPRIQPEDDVNTRDDRRHNPEQPAAPRPSAEDPRPNPPAPAATPGVITEAQYQELGALVQAHKVAPEVRALILKRLGIDSAKKVPVPMFQWTKEALTDGLAPPEQVDRISKAITDQGRSWDKFRAWLEKEYGTTSIQCLLPREADRVEEIVKKPAAASPPAG